MGIKGGRHRVEERKERGKTDCGKGHGEWEERGPG